MEYGGDPHQTNKRKVTPLNASITSRVSQALRYTEPTSFFHPAKNEVSTVFKKVLNVVYSLNRQKVNSFSSRASFAFSTYRASRFESFHESFTNLCLAIFYDIEFMLRRFWSIQSSNINPKFTR